MTIDTKELLQNYSYMITIPGVEKFQNRLKIERQLFRRWGLIFPKLFNGVEKAHYKFHKQGENSHWLIIEMAKQLDLPYILVFEDDAYPCNNVLEYLTKTLQDIPDNIDILQLGFNDNTNYNISYTNKNNIEFIHIEKCIPFHTKNDRFDGGTCSGFHAVIYFKSGYTKCQKILETHLPCDCIQKFVNSYVLKYPLFIQYDPIRFPEYPYTMWSQNQDVRKFYNTQYSYIEQPQKLNDICKSKIQLDLRKILPDSPCPLGNSGIISLNDETYLTVFREFDYRLPSYEKIYKPISKFYSCWGLLDNNFMPIDENIKINVKIDNQTCGQINILSDSRLFNWNNEIFCSGTAMSNDAYVGKVHICKNELTVDVQYKYHNEKKKEKNWLAIPNQPFKFIYEVKKDRTRIIDTQTNEISEVGHLIRINNDELRGNTPLLRINNNEFLAIFHTRIGLRYTHYFLVFDKNNRLLHMSRPFTFDVVHKTEFPISMFYVNKTNGQQIGITVCENDMYQYVYTFDKQTLIDFIYYNLDKSTINVYYWDGKKNFGDLLAPTIIEFLSGAKSKTTQDNRNKLLSIGSVLDIQNIPNNGDVVWGSGIHCNCKIHANNLDVRLLRGPLTRDVLLKNGISAPQKYCDSGVLAPFCYNIDKKQTIIRDILVLLHFDDDKQKVSQCLEKLKIHYMYMDKNSPVSILNEIARSRQVVSSSLHGIIAAEALGKPAVLLQESGNHESMFKYTDYYLGSGRTKDDIKTTTLDEIQNDMSKVQFTKPAKFDFKSLIETFPLRLKDDTILEKALKYYNT